jgi:hypothetical protein
VGSEWKNASCLESRKRRSSGFVCAEILFYDVTGKIYWSVPSFE